MDNLFNTDSGFRPPSPLTFSSAPGPSLFGDSLGFEDFRFANQDFLNMSAAATTAPVSSSPSQPGGGTAPPFLPGMIMSDPSMQLFNPSEQRYFSEFLDTLVVDQDFTFDPSAIPNLPNLPLFTQDVVMPGGFNMDINNPYRMPGVLPPPPQQQQTPQLPSQQSSMDYNMSSGSFNDQQAPLYTQQQQHPISVPAKRTKTNKGGASASTSSTSIDNPTRRGTPTSSRPPSLDAHAASTAQDPTGNRIATPIQQLSKLSLNQSAAQAAAAAAAASATTSSIKAKKNKREEDDPAQPGSSNGNLNQRSPTSRSQPYNLQHHYHQRQQKEGSRDRNTSMSDEDGGGSDSLTGTNGASASTSASADAGAPPSKRKPYKELLTEEEKRANHIASEQKRRNTIRNGFKDMTDIIPDLKDVNSSKSTILFKAVDFIKHLERRNRLLQEKATQLESRLLMQKGGGGSAGAGSNGHQHIQSQAQAHQHQAQQHSSSTSSFRTSPYDTQHHHHPQQQPQHGAAHLPQYHNQHHSHHAHHHQQQHHSQQALYHNSGLDDKRLQDIPNIYPVSMSR